LVAELGLDLVPGLRQLAVAAQLGARDDGEDLLVRHGEAQVRSLAILEAEHVLAHHRPAAALFPHLPRVQRRQVELLPADRVLLLANDARDLEQASLPEGQDAVDPGSQLADESGAHEQLVACHLRIGRNLLEGGDERARRAHRHPFRLSSRSTVSLNCSYGTAPLMKMPLTKKAGVPLTPA